MAQLRVDPCSYQRLQVCKRFSFLRIRCGPQSTKMTPKKGQVTAYTPAVNTKTPNPHYSARPVQAHRERVSPCDQTAFFDTFSIACHLIASQVFFCSNTNASCCTLSNLSLTPTTAKDNESMQPSLHHKCSSRPSRSQKSIIPKPWQNIF